MGSLHAHALFPHGTGPYSAHWSEEAHAAPSAGNIRALCMIPGPLGTKTARQDSRPMHDSEALDAKMPPPWQDLRAMYPKSPDCTLKRIHGAKILPSSARKACISRKRCQGGASFRAISEKRIHDARILPHQPKQPYRHDEAIGRRSTSPKKGPGTTAKSPNTKATPAKPLFLTPEATLKSICHQGDSRKGTNPRSMKQ